MAERQARTFTATPAERNGTSALLIGISAPSGGGKTYSALRVARGIVNVVGGEIYFIDTDNGRALDYADLFRKADGSPGFKHVPFEPPHSSLAYRDALRYCQAQPDCGVVIVDSMSHEHVAMLEHADAELDRMAGDNESKRKAMKTLSYAAPKAARTALLTEVQRLSVPGIFCFRAKEGIKPVKNERGFTEFVQQGFTPIAGDEFVYEMTLCALLMPAAKGVPTWLPTEPGEKKMTKLPEQFSFLESITKPMDETLGEGLAKWARGGPKGARAISPPESRQEAPVDRGPETRTEPSTPPGEPESGHDVDFPGDPRDEPVDQDQAARNLADNAKRVQTELNREAAAHVPESFGVLAGFAAFADTLADADDWPSIAAGLRELTKAADWNAATYERQMHARAAAYHRLRDLTNQGKGLDFLADAQAFRCYVEAEDAPDVLKLHWSAFKGGAIWPKLGDAQEVFATAVSRRLSTLTAAGSTVEDFR